MWRSRHRALGETGAAVGFAAALLLGAAAAPRTLRTGGLLVELDLHLPRPIKVLHLSSGVDFSPPNASAAAGPPPPPAPAPSWWQHVANHALLNTTGGEGCTPPHCSVLGPFPRGHGQDNCSRACGSGCAGWSLAKDTPLSGRHGKGSLCQLYTVAGLAASPPHYAADPNFDCGTNTKLQPNPPAGLGSGSSIPASAACIGVLSINGSTTLFCAGRNETTTAYTGVPDGSTVGWTVHLAALGHGIQVKLTGTATVQDDSGSTTGGGGSSALSWSLLSASSEQIQVRAVDLGFAFVGLSGAGDRYYYTQSHKAWTPPGVSGMEWSCHTVDGTVGEDEGGEQQQRPVVQTDGYPPLPLPFAAQALLDPSRSNGVGGWTGDGKAGVGAYSSQRTLPFRRFHQCAAAGPTTAVGLGSARINTNLRCGSVLPLHLRFGMFSDVTGDRKADADDSTVWTRSQYPLADFAYRGSVVLKIDNDISSYLMPWNPSPSRVSFNETLDYIAAIAALTDNMPMIMHLVGWGGTGLDTGIYNEINARLGTLADLRRLKDEALAKHNTIVSYHIDTDNAYANLTACSAQTAAGNWSATSGHPVPGTKDGQPTPGFNASMLSLSPAGEYWIWDMTSASMRTDPLQGPCYHINKAKDVASGGRLRRYDEMYATVPMSDVLHMDAYRDIDVSFESDPAGYIAEDEEAACGLGWDLQWLRQHNLSLGVEGANGMASVGGPNPPAMDVFDYYWRDGSPSLGDWGRIVMGTAQGVNTDMPYAHIGCWAHQGCDCSNMSMCSTNASTNPFGHWESLADTIYLQTKPYTLTLTGAGAGGDLLSFNRSSGEMYFGNGGTRTHWPHGASTIEYFRPSVAESGPAQHERPGNHEAEGSGMQSIVGAAVFVPEVLLPPSAGPRTAPTTFNPRKIFAYLHSGASAAQNHTWEMPDTWSGLQVSAITITPSGRVRKPAVHVRGRNLTLELTPGRPVVLTVPKRADKVHWSAGNGSTVVSVSTTVDSFFRVGVVVNGSEWLDSCGVQIRCDRAVYDSRVGGSLMPKVLGAQPTISVGNDLRLGAFTSVSQSWRPQASFSSSRCEVHTAVYYYIELDFFEFRLTTPAGVNGSNDPSASSQVQMVARNLTQVSSSFPNFTLSRAAMALGSISWNTEFLAGHWEQSGPAVVAPGSAGGPLSAPAYCGNAKCLPYTGGMTSGPLLLFTPSTADTPPLSLTVAPITGFKTAFVASTSPTTVYAGSQPFLTSLPAGFSTRVGLFGRRGIQESLVAMGAAAQRIAQTKRLSLERDQMSRQLSYFMDEGSVTCACELLNEKQLKPISVTVAELKGYHSRIDLSVGIYSRGGPSWYATANHSHQAGGRDGCISPDNSPWAKSFTPSHWHFPRGIDPERNAPALAFYSWLSSHDTCAYAASGTGWDVERVDAWYDKLSSGRPGNFNKTLVSPANASAFWLKVLSEGKTQNGLAAVTWDGVAWITYVFAAHLSQAGLTEEMMHGFADSCAALGLPIRVDIHDPSDVAMSVELPAWTVSRCGPDAIPSSQQVTPQKSPTGAERGNWHLIGANGQLISAYGVRPMNDVLWSVSAQPNPYRDSNKPIAGRLNIEHDLIVATLSTGPVGIGDAVGHSNRSFLLPAMRADGVIIKPSRPALRLDRFFASADPKARQQEIWSAPSRLLNSTDSGSMYFTVLATNLVPGATAVSVSELWPPQSGDAKFYASRGFYERCANNSLASSCLDVFDSTHPLSVDTGTLPSLHDPIRRFQLRSVAPVLSSGWTIIGEQAKYVRVSEQRLGAAAGTGQLLRVMGRHGESVEVTLVSPAGMVMIQVVTIGPEGTSTLELPCHH